ncbi:MAG TPA: lipocalin family protein, partial [Candidatus Acidoferrales bacterium]|nr:lipocalin family protein [Candidatus Acidoferrales bacterium]
SLIDRRGAVHPLTLADFLVESHGLWHSPHTAAAYPDRWHVRLPAEHLDILLTPTVADQELADPSSSYWEGAVNVADVTHGGAPCGVGYVELTGYVEAVRL